MSGVLHTISSSSRTSFTTSTMSIESLLRKARSSLAAGGHVLAVEFVPNEDRVSPPFPAMFSFMMLGSTPKGDAYTEREFEQMGRTAGFQEVSFASLPPTPQTVVTFA